MTTGKSTTLAFRIEPELQEALRTAAEREYRSIANMVAVLIMDHCERIDIEIQGALATTSKSSPRRKRG